MYSCPRYKTSCIESLKFVVFCLILGCGQSTPESLSDSGLDSNVGEADTDTNMNTDTITDTDFDGGMSSDASSDAGGDAGSDAGFSAVTDYDKRGSFETSSGSEGPSCVIHHPKDLGQGGLKHPVIIWGNGTFGFPAVYAGLLGHWASHGFIVAAAKTTNAGTGKEMLACAEFLIRKNDEAGHKYEGNVDTDHIGASGHSQGGGGSIMAGADDRVTITAPLEPFVIGLGHQTSSQSQQSGPMFLMSGGLDVLAPAATNQAPVFSNSNVPTFWGTLNNADHAVTPLGDAGGFRGPATAWFRLHLMADENARSMFYGEDCGLCTNPNWTVQRKDMK